jgi:hypothetical protein
MKRSEYYDDLNEFYNWLKDQYWEYNKSVLDGKGLNFVGRRAAILKTQKQFEKIFMSYRGIK